MKAAETQLDHLEQDFAAKGYRKAATYVSNAKERLFGHLRPWLETGIVCPPPPSIIENLIRELVRRLKMTGWNWSDAGAARMGPIVMIRRYDPEVWEEYWNRRMDFPGRCQIDLSTCERRRVAQPAISRNRDAADFFDLLGFLPRKLPRRHLPSLEFGQPNQRQCDAEAQPMAAITANPFLRPH